MMTAVEKYSALSGEIIPTAKGDADWSLLLHFDSSEHMRNWKNSPERTKLFENADAQFQINETEQDDNAATIGSVAMAIITQVKPGHEDAYYETAAKYQCAQANYKGYRGAYLQPPTHATPGQWTTLIRFDSPESLDKWLTSKERAALLTESEAIVETTDYQRVATSFPGWFPQTQGTRSGPPNWKTGMLVLLGLYPIVMIERIFLVPHLSSLNLSLSLFISLIISVAGTTFVTMPASVKWFDSWLFPPPDSTPQMRAMMFLSIAVTYAIMVAIFSRMTP